MIFRSSWEKLASIPKTGYYVLIKLELVLKTTSLFGHEIGSLAIIRSQTLSLFEIETNRVAKYNQRQSKACRLDCGSRGSLVFVECQVPGARSESCVAEISRRIVAIGTVMLQFSSVILQVRSSLIRCDSFQLNIEKLGNICRLFLH